MKAKRSGQNVRMCRIYNSLGHLRETAEMVLFGKGQINKPIEAARHKKDPQAKPKRRSYLFIGMSPRGVVYLRNLKGHDECPSPPETMRSAPESPSATPLPSS